MVLRRAEHNQWLKDQATTEIIELLVTPERESKAWRACVHRLVIIFLFACIVDVPAQERVRVMGEYSYTYGDNESLVEAKEICYTMAVRNAIESYQIFVTSTTAVQDYRLKNDLIQTLSSGYLEDLSITESKIVGRKVAYQVSAYVNPGVFKDVIRREVKKREEKHEVDALIVGKHLKILSAKRTESQVTVVYQKKGWRYEYWKRVFGESKAGGYDVIMIDYYDGDGNPIGGDKAYTEYDLKNGEIRSTTFLPPNGVKSYRVWPTPRE